MVRARVSALNCGAHHFPRPLAPPANAAAPVQSGWRYRRAGPWPAAAIRRAAGVNQPRLAQGHDGRSFGHGVAGLVFAEYRADVHHAGSNRIRRGWLRSVCRFQGIWPRSPRQSTPARWPGGQPGEAVGEFTLEIVLVWPRRASSSHRFPRTHVGAGDAPGLVLGPVGGGDAPERL